MKLITCSVDYVCGHLRDGHYELKLTDEEYEEFQQSTDEEKEDWIRDGDLIIDSYRVDDVGSLGEIKVTES